MNQHPDFLLRQHRSPGLIFLASAALLLILLLPLLSACRKKPVPAPASSGISYDPGAAAGGWDDTDLTAVVDGLNQQVEDGMIHISMNVSPVFFDGSSEGSLMIVNESVNRYPQVVQITRNDTHEEIYRSGAIPVGSRIASARLNRSLPAGTYECTAMFYNVDPVSGDFLGCAGAMIRITIQNETAERSH